MARTPTPVAAILLMMLVVAGTRSEAFGPDESCAGPGVFQIRTSSCRIGRDLDAGLERSATFRRLVDRVGALKGIVYIDVRPLVEPETRREIRGALQHHVTVAGDYRLLHVVIAPSGDAAVGTIAHELQHAIEVLESNATTEADVDRLFDRIGAPSGAWFRETAAAITAGRAVALEVNGRR
jgi:hypothetical protein